MEAPARGLPGLNVTLRKLADGPVVGSEPIMARDLVEPMTELGFAAGLRRGHPELSLANLSARLRPVLRSTQRAGRVCTGFTLETDAPIGETVVRHFDRSLLGSAAARASRRLVQAGVLEKDDFYYYHLDFVETTIEPIVIEGDTPPPTPTIAEIAPLLRRAREVKADPIQGRLDEAYAREQETLKQRPNLDVVRGSLEQADSDRPALAATESLHHPVFFEQHALERAERIARKGARCKPAIETGGLLNGRLCWCPDSHVFYVVIDDVIEASHAEGTTYSMTFSPQTWERIRVVLEARRRHAATRDQCLIGQVHGHNFIPFDDQQGQTCDGCPAQGTCNLSTAYLSEDDRRWCRAVFPKMPWQGSLIFGLTPRREPVRSFYGQVGTVLERRPFYVLDRPD